MFNKGRTKTLLTLISVSAGLWISLSVTRITPESVCQYHFSPQYSAVLPVNTADNECALDQATQVSWLSWVSGKSLSYQFHFLDLLELLYGNSAEIATSIRD